MHFSLLTPELSLTSLGRTTILPLLLTAVVGCTRPTSESIVARKLQADAAVEPTPLPSLPDRAAVAIIRLHSQAPTVLGDGRSPDPQEQQAYREAQAAFLRSPLVVEAALRSEEVAGMPQVQDADDPAEWLRDRIEVAFSGGGELMEVRVAAEGMSDEELTALTDALCQAYMQEVVEAEQREQMMLKDVLAGQLDHLSAELAKKRQQHADLANRFARSDAKRELLHIQYRDALEERRMLLRKAAEAELEFQLQLIDLDATPQPLTLARRAARPPLRAAAGRDAAEAPADQAADARADEASDENNGNGDGNGGPPDTPASGDDGGERPAPWHRWHPAAKAYDRYQATQKGLEKQIESLDAEAAEIEEQILDQSAPNMALAPLEDDIRRYERLVNEMGERLLRWDVELAAPNRVRIVQNAVVRPVHQAAKERSESESSG